MALSCVPYGDRGRSFAIRAFGRTFAICISDHELLLDVLKALPPRWRPMAWTGEADRYFRVVRRPGRSHASQDWRFDIYEDQEPEPIRKGVTAKEVQSEIEWRLEDDVSERGYPEIFVHAGVVEWRGNAIVLPGHSMQGKSTLVAALVDAGATYFSDEYAVVDAQGAIWPYPRAPKLRADIHHARRDMGKETILARPVDGPIPASLVAVMDYVPGSGLQLTPLRGAAAIMSICQYAFALRTRPEDTFELIGKLVETALVFQGTRGDASAIAKRLLALAETASHP